MQEVRALVMLLQNAFWSFKAPSVTQVVAEMCEQWWMWGDEDVLGPALVEYRLRVIGAGGASTADVDALFRCLSALAEPENLSALAGREEDLRMLSRQCARSAVFWRDEDRGREMLEIMENIVGAGALLTNEEQEEAMRCAWDEDVEMDMPPEMVAANAVVGGEKGTMMVMNDASDGGGGGGSGGEGRSGGGSSDGR